MIRSPVLILGCPRSGTTLLYNILSEIPDLWSIGFESKAIIERYHHPRARNWESGALDASDLTPTSQRFILSAFQRQSAPGTFWRKVNRFRSTLRRVPVWRQIKRRGRSTAAGSAIASALPQQGLDVLRALVRARNLMLPRGDAPGIRLLEKTPENCLRLPFLAALFPDARVLYLTRDGRANASSLIEGWRHPHSFPGYQVPEPITVPGDTRGRWAFALIPGWRDLCASPLEEVCAWQWVRCNQAVLDYRDQTSGHLPFLTIRYEDLVADAAATLKQVAQFIQADYRRHLAHHAEALPRINVVSEPGLEKWHRRNQQAIERVLPIIEAIQKQLGYDT